MLGAPEINLIEPVEVPDTPEKMEAVARRQVAWTGASTVRTPWAAGCCWRELTRDAVTGRTLADLT
jgi:hypothetical protein